MCALGPSVVHIQPIIAHLPHGDLAEAGVGGGGDDLEREAEIDLISQGDLQFLLDRSAAPSPDLGLGPANGRQHLLL